MQLTVKPSSVADLPQNDLLFEVIPRQTEIYVQSQVIVKLRLLSAKNISAYQFGDIVLENVDAVIEPLGDVQDYQTRVADRTYLVLEQRFALFPQQSGRLGIPSILAEVRLPSGSSFDPFRSSGEIRRIRSQPVHIEIKPIPAAADGEFWLPARQVMLREELPDDLDDLVAGEPITRSLSIVADGLTAAQLPEIEVPAIDGIKQYPDQPGLNNRRSGNGITGMRTQKIALIPSSAGVYQLPEISLRWWNLQTGQLETASIPARELRVGGAAPATTATESRSGTADLAGTATARDSGDGIWLWVSLLLALGWGINVIYWRYRIRNAQTARHPDTHVTSMRQARKSLQLACAANDASRARDALLHWGRALLAPRPVVNLHQLERLFGSDFADELTRLNRSLFSAGPDDWHGADLWRACQALESRYQNRASPDTSELSPLNP